MNFTKHIRFHNVVYQFQEEIKHALERVCKKLGKIKHKCESFVEKHGDQITDLLLKELAPKQICRIMGLCSTPEAADDRKTHFHLFFRL